MEDSVALAEVVDDVDFQEIVSAKFDKNEAEQDCDCDCAEEC